MKILSNFDTNMAEKLYDEYVQIFGAEYVALVHKSRLIRYAQIFFPLFLFISVVIIVSYFVYTYEMPHEIIYRMFRGVVLIRSVILFIKLSHKYVDFKMDFLVVTPREVMKYDQHGVFSRITEKIGADKIKSITIQKNGFLASFFDIGTLVFLAEGETAEGDIIMDYIDAIEATDTHLRHILGKDKVISPAS